VTILPKYQSTHSTGIDFEWVARITLRSFYHRKETWPLDTLLSGLYGGHSDAGQRFLTRATDNNAHYTRQFCTMSQISLSIWMYPFQIPNASLCRSAHYIRSEQTTREFEYCNAQTGRYLYLRFNAAETSRRKIRIWWREIIKRIIEEKF
jgi:hypothetical protein